MKSNVTAYLHVLLVRRESKTHGWQIAAAALLCLASLPAAAHVLEFTPTQSIGSSYWANPTPVIITYTGGGAFLQEMVAPDQGIFSPTGTNNGVTSYQDGLNPGPLDTILPDGLLELPAANSAFLLINSVGLSVDHVQDLNEIAVRGDVEGYGSDGVTPCGEFSVPPFSGVCEAAGYWTLDGVVISSADEPPALMITVLLGAIIVVWIRKTLGGREPQLF